MHPTVLIIDDDRSLREMLAAALRDNGHTVATAPDGPTGLSMLPEVEPQIVLLDVRMPRMGGPEVLQNICATDPGIETIMISSVDEVETVRSTLREGAYDYLLKPLEVPIVLEAVERAAEHRKLRLEVDEYRRNLESLVESRTKELHVAIERQEQIYTQTILTLGAALETRDVETREHSQRVAGYTIAICRKLGITDGTALTAIERGAYLHDIGKIGVPDQILLKAGPLTADEWTVMKRHPVIGAEMLEGIEFLRDSLALVRSHHERWDGAGYPDRLSESRIPVEARAFAIADTLDAITSDRPYRKRQPIVEARRIIESESGTQFDPDAVDAFRSIGDDEILTIRDASSRGTLRSTDKRPKS